MKSSELKYVTQKVEFLLRNYPDTRNSDAVLYARLCEMLNPVVRQVPFSIVMRYMHEYGIPPAESVRRARQKLQAKYPELAASERVSAGRFLNEEVYREYAKEN